ncbi:MAG: hypothetical protein M5U34_06670 [Chloroflexi bacterium]|nr:hypothetical protein [Chloroflexota bacterium]
MIWEAESVRWIQVQLADGGGLGIWPGHRAAAGGNGDGSARYADDAGEQAINLAAGILQIAAGEVTIFTSGFVETAAPEKVSGAVGSAVQGYGRLLRSLGR